MIELETLIRDLTPHGMLSVGDKLVAYQSHHHSIFLDQSVIDALGGEAWLVRRRAAFDASLALLTAAFRQLGVEGEKDRLAAASEIFTAMGHGRLTFDLASEGGSVKAESLHFGAGFAEKYGSLVTNKRMLDAFGAGYCAAAATLAFPVDGSVFDAAELACVGRRDALCSFTLARRPPPSTPGALIVRAAAEGLPTMVADESSPPTNAARAAKVTRLLSSARASDSGVIHAYGSRVALFPCLYSNQISSDVMVALERRSPELLAVFIALAREAAQMGAFHLLTGILSSPSFAASVGPVASDPGDRLEQLLAIARGLGWGSFYRVELAPGRTLVLRSKWTPETAYHAARGGDNSKVRLPFLQGMALAMMQILHRVDFKGSPLAVTRDAYNALFRSGTRFLVEETRSPLRGDDVSEVLVEAIAD